MLRPRTCSICGELEKIGENSSGDSIYPRRSPERKPRKHWFSMEPVVGIEPTTYGLRNRHYLHDAACKRSKAQHNETRSSLVEWEWTDKMFPFVPTGLAEDEEKKHSFPGQGKSSAPHPIPLFGGGSLPRIPPLKIFR